MSDQLKEIVYSKDSIEFVTVAVQYCAFLEDIEDITEAELNLINSMKLLPLFIPESIACARY